MTPGPAAAAAGEVPQAPPPGAAARAAASGVAPQPQPIDVHSLILTLPVATAASPSFTVAASFSLAPHATGLPASSLPVDSVTVVQPTPFDVDVVTPATTPVTLTTWSFHFERPASAVARNASTVTGLPSVGGAAALGSSGGPGSTPAIFMHSLRLPGSSHLAIFIGLVTEATLSPSLVMDA